MPLKKDFFNRKTDIVARDLLGKILCRKKGNRILKAKITETEAYFGEKDPASRASKGRNKISWMMWESPGRILVYNVHKYKMLNFIAEKKGKAGAVLIRAVEPLNFKARASGPGLLTNALEIGSYFHGKDICNLKELFLEDSREKIEIQRSFRIGVAKDLPIKLRFYIKGSKFISRK